MNETTELIMKQLNQKKTHAVTHEVGGGDEIDATLLKNYLNDGTVTADKLAPYLIASIDNVAIQQEFDERGINVQKYGAIGNGVADDTSSIQSAITASNNKVVYFPDGTYNITSAITITNDVSIILSPNATIKAVSAMAAMVVYNNGNTNGGKNRYIQGGILDGNGLANNCLTVTLCAHLILDGVLFKNPLNRGIKQDAGYELIGRNLFFNNTLTTNITDNIAIDINSSDAIFDTFVITNFTVGIKVTQGGNYFSNGHIWGGQTARFSTCVGIDNQGIANHYHAIYFDTRAIGFKTTYRSYLTNCLFIDGGEIRAGIFPTNVINIQVVNTLNCVAENCYFECKTGAQAYRSTVVSGQTNYIQMINCDFATPSTLDAIPVNNRTRKEYRFRVTFSSFGAIPANSSVNNFGEKEITISETDFTIDFRDDFRVQSNGRWETGLVPEFYLKDTKVCVILRNISTGIITPANHQVWFTIIKNSNNSFNDYRTIS